MENYKIICVVNIQRFSSGKRSTCKAGKVNSTTGSKSASNKGTLGRKSRKIKELLFTVFAYEN